MDTYHIWCNLKDGVGDLEFSGHVRSYLDHLQAGGVIAGYRLTRRKLGFGPPELGEFHIAIAVNDLAQLERAFQRVAGRQGETERLHARVYASARDLRFALYRDFPDSVREKGE